MSTLAERLRELAADLEHETRLIPTPAAEVKVGDVVSWTVGELVTVTQVRITDRSKSNGMALISMEGEVFPADPDDYQPRCTSYYADEWVVVQR